MIVWLGEIVLKIIRIPYICAFFLWFLYISWSCRCNISACHHKSVYVLPLSTFGKFRIPLPLRIPSWCTNYPIPRTRVHIIYRRFPIIKDLKTVYYLKQSCVFSTTTTLVSFHFHQRSYHRYLWRSVQNYYWTAALTHPYNLSLCTKRQWKLSFRDLFIHINICNHHEDSITITYIVKFARAILIGIYRMFLN